MTNTYSKKVMNEFLHPKNMGEMKNPDGVGKVGNPRCGDIMQVQIRVRSGIIEDIKFKTFGCAAAIATSSMITQMAKGKTIEEAKKITNQDIAESLKGLPLIKMHCSNLASSALKKAIDDYKNREKKIDLSGLDSDEKKLSGYYRKKTAQYSKKP